MAKIGRLLTSMVTPFDASGEVNYIKAAELARGLVRSGSDGVVVAGTTGEAPTLTRDEQTRLFIEVRDAIDSEFSVVAGTGSNSTICTSMLSSANSISSEASPSTRAAAVGTPLP